MLGMAVGICTPSQAQMGGMGGGMGGGMPTIPGTAFGGATDPSSIKVVEGLRLIPSVQLSERYDSNVFFAPKSQLREVNPHDIITTVLPQVRGLYADREQLVKVNATVGAVGSYYTTNTGLSYVGANGGVVLNMSDLLSRWRPGTTWTVSDTFFYTPQPPAFVLGGYFAEAANPLVAGFQATRTNTTSNSVNSAFELPLNRTVNLRGSYTYSFVNYGASPVRQGALLISQNAQIYSAGFSVQMSLQDIVRVEFTSYNYDQDRLGSFNTRGGLLTWIHRFSPAVSLNAVGGVQVLTAKQTDVQSSSEIAPFGSLAIRWQDPTTSIALVYRSGITPSFQFRSAAMLNHSVSLTMTQNTPISDLVGLLEANYSIANDYGSNSPFALSWTTVAGTAGLLYRATQKTFFTLFYSYLNVDNVNAGIHFAFDKHLIQLGVAQRFP